MKIILFIIGTAISIFGVIKISQNNFTGKALSEYGKGYIFGNVVLILIGLSLIFFAWKKKK